MKRERGRKNQVPKEKGKSKAAQSIQGAPPGWWRWAVAPPTGQSGWSAILVHDLHSQVSASPTGLRMLAPYLASPGLLGTVICPTQHHQVTLKLKLKCTNVNSLQCL